MNNKHTPGPLEIQPLPLGHTFENSERSPIIQESASGKEIASIYWVRDENDEVDVEATISNAQLFVDAPETLRQRDKLAAFAKHCIETYCWDIQDPDGIDIQDKAEELGLIKKVVATADHYDPEYSDFEIGDTIYEFADFMDK